MRTLTPGVVYRVTYKRRGWKHPHAHAFLSKRGAEGFAARVRSKGKPVDELRIEGSLVDWIPVDEPTGTAKRPTAISVPEYTPDPEDPDHDPEDYLT